MQRYILKRILQAIITAIVVVTAVFFMIRASGIDPTQMMIDPRSPKEAREVMKKALGLDKSLIVQYRIYMINMLQGDFGTSFIYSRPVMDLILERTFVSLKLTVSALFLTILFAIPIGVYSAVKRGGFIDIFGRAFAFLGISAPIFWVALVAIYIFSVKLRIFPVGGSKGLISMVLPVLVMAISHAAGLVRMTRSGMMDVLNADYITMARAKGVPRWIVTWKHAFKNASISISTMITLMMLGVLAGNVVIETIFAWPGLGWYIMQATLARDFPVVQAITILVSFAFIIINLMGDILYALLNPKIRY